MKRFYLAVSLLIVSLVLAVLSFDVYAKTPAADAVVSAIKAQWAKPNNPIDVPVVAVGERYALADWIQGGQGGRALLHLDHGKWVTLMCGNANMKSVQTLESMGMSKVEAVKISGNLKMQEANLTKKQLAIIDSFQGIVEVLTNAGHHEHH